MILRPKKSIIVFGIIFFLYIIYSIVISYRTNNEIKRLNKLFAIPDFPDREVVECVEKIGLPSIPIILNYLYYYQLCRWLIYRESEINILNINYKEGQLSFILEDFEKNGRKGLLRFLENYDFKYSLEIYIAGVVYLGSINENKFEHLKFLYRLLEDDKKFKNLEDVYKIGLETAILGAFRNTMFLLKYQVDLKKISKLNILDIHRKKNDPKRQKMVKIYKKWLIDNKEKLFEASKKEANEKSFFLNILEIWWSIHDYGTF